MKRMEGILIEQTNIRQLSKSIVCISIQKQGQIETKPLPVSND